MTGSADGDPGEHPPAPDPLIGTPERNSAQEALEVHLIEKRLTPAEYELGLAYGILWALVVPVVATVAMTYTEHIRTAGREQVSDHTPHSAEDA